MKKLLTILFLIPIVVFGQSGYDLKPIKTWFKDSILATKAVKINSQGGLIVGGYNLNSDLVLEASSTTKAFAPPRMTAAQRLAISMITNGAMVFDTDSGKLCIYNSSWVCLSNSSGSGRNPYFQNGLSNLNDSTGELGGDLLHDTEIGFDPRVNYIGFGGGGGFITIGNFDADGLFKFRIENIDGVLVTNTGGDIFVIDDVFFKAEDFQSIVLSTSDGGNLTLASGGEDGCGIGVDSLGLKFIEDLITLYKIDTIGEITELAYPNVRTDVATFTPTSLYYPGSNGERYVAPLSYFGIGQPANQIVVGTGAGQTSYDNFLFNNTTKTFSSINILGAQKSSLVLSGTAGVGLCQVSQYFSIEDTFTVDHFRVEPGLGKIVIGTETNDSTRYIYINAKDSIKVRTPKIVPTDSAVTDLGTARRPFRDVYMTGSSLYLGAAHFTDSGIGASKIPMSNGSNVVSFSTIKSILDTGIPTYATVAAALLDGKVTGDYIKIPLTVGIVTTNFVITVP